MKIKFKREPKGGFHDTLKERVQAYVNSQNGDIRANLPTILKSLALPALHMGLYLNLILNPPGTIGILLTFLAMGLLVALTFLNTVHEAGHQGIFKNKMLNNLLVHLLDLYGANGYIWKVRHVQSHHSYPNIPFADVDIKQSPIVKIFPHQAHIWFNSYQHVYMPIIYFFYTLNWLLYRDYVDFRELVFGPKVIKPDWKQWVVLIGMKLFYFFYILFVPIFVVGLSWQIVLLGFLIMHMATSFVAILTVLTAHVGEHALFPVPDEEGNMEFTWSEHQLKTTADFSPNSKLVNFLFGGFNLHVPHHLFQNISHRHYPEISKIIKETADEYGLEYQQFSLWEALRSHFRLLKKNSIKVNLSVFHEF